MGAIYRDNGMPQGLYPTGVVCDFFEERVAEQVEAQKTVVSLSQGWWLYPQVNMISDKYQQRIRCGYTAHNWHLYMRNGWYWANQKGAIA